MSSGAGLSINDRNHSRWWHEEVLTGRQEMGKDQNTSLGVKRTDFVLERCTDPHPHPPSRAWKRSRDRMGERKFGKRGQGVGNQKGDAHTAGPGKAKAVYLSSSPCSPQGAKEHDEGRAH